MWVCDLCSGLAWQSKSAALRHLGSWQQLEPGWTTIILWCGSAWLFVKVKIELLCAFTGDMTKRVVLGHWETVCWQGYWFTALFQMSFDCDACNHMILKSILSLAFLGYHKGEIKHLGKLVGKQMTTGRETEGRKKLDGLLCYKTPTLTASNLLALLVKNSMLPCVNLKVNQMVYQNACFQTCRYNKPACVNLSVCPCSDQYKSLRRKTWSDCLRPLKHLPQGRSFFHE